MIRRMFLLVACLGVAAPLWAQTPAPVEDPAKPQVQAFEMVLRGAVDLGGQRFAQQAAKVDRASAGLVAPYLGWIGFANLLTGELFRLNHNRLTPAYSVH